jgi:hypothetical protein
MSRGWSDWAVEAFGARVAELWERIPAALAKAHRRARAAHDAAQSKNQRVYGTALWELQHEELVAAVSSVNGAKPAKFGGYELPVVAGKVLFPLRYTDQAGVPVERARLPMPVSPQRERLFGAHAPEVERPHPFLDESWAELELPADYEAYPQLGDGAELIVIAYACNLEAGVLHIEWGRAEHVGDGELRWGDHSPLPLPTTAGQHLVTAGRAGVPRFDVGEAPGLALGLRHPGDRELNRPPQTERHPDQPHAQDNDHA